MHSPFPFFLLFWLLGPAKWRSIANLLFKDGFFDAGMLLQALKARNENFDSGETKPSERAQVHAKRRDVGKKLRLIDY